LPKRGGSAFVQLRTQRSVTGNGETFFMTGDIIASPVTMLKYALQEHKTEDISFKNYEWGRPFATGPDAGTRAPNPCQGSPHRQPHVALVLPRQSIRSRAAGPHRQPHVALVLPNRSIRSSAAVPHVQTHVALVLPSQSIRSASARGERHLSRTSLQCHAGTPGSTLPLYGKMPYSVPLQGRSQGGGGGGDSSPERKQISKEKNCKKKYQNKVGHIR